MTVYMLVIYKTNWPFVMSLPHLFHPFMFPFFFFTFIEANVYIVAGGKSIFSLWHCIFNFNGCMHISHTLCHRPWLHLINEELMKLLDACRNKLCNPTCRFSYCPSVVRNSQYVVKYQNAAVHLTDFHTHTFITAIT